MSIRLCLNLARRLAARSNSTCLQLCSTAAVCRRAATANGFSPGHVGAPLVLLASVAIASAATNDWPITYEHIRRTEPNLSIHVARVDLADPRVSVTVTPGGADPDGDGPWVTTLLPTSEMAARERLALAVNGDFFLVPTNAETGRIVAYRRGVFARPQGWARTDGRDWHLSEARRAAVAITLSNTVAFLHPDRSQPPGTHLPQVLGGGPMLLRNGQMLVREDSTNPVRHPRTAVGTDATGRELILLVVDGRQPALSVGMTLAELATELARLGCTDAMNLDGGGSSTLVLQTNATARLRVLNSPSDGRERAVVNGLGVRVRAAAAGPP